VINGLASRFTSSSLRAPVGVQRTSRFAGLALGCAICVVLPACWSPSGIFGPPTKAPDCSSYSWIVIPLSSAELLVLDPGATPPQARLKVGPSVDTSKPATRGRFKAGHHGVASETGGGLPRSLLRVQVGVDLGAPASGPALEDVGMVEQAVE